jgi:hypothetical protein
MKLNFFFEQAIHYSLIGNYEYRYRSQDIEFINSKNVVYQLDLKIKRPKSRNDIRQLSFVFHLQWENEDTLTWYLNDVFFETFYIEHIKENVKVHSKQLENHLENAIEISGAVIDEWSFLLKEVTVIKSTEKVFLMAKQINYICRSLGIYD